jgi:hypothetical protein
MTTVSEKFNLGKDVFAGFGKLDEGCTGPLPHDV